MGQQAPGHPERGITPGVEVTTGPLGQRFGNGWGWRWRKPFLQAGVSLGWRPYVGPGIAVIGVDRCGVSAPEEIVMQEYSFSVDHINQRALELIEQQKEAKYARHSP